MHRRRRTPSAQTRAAQLTPQLRTVLIIDALATGAGYAFGPETWHTSPTLAVINSLQVPWEVWGILYGVGALLLASSRSEAQAWGGHAFLALIYLFWGLAMLATGLTGQLAAWGNPVHVLAVAAIHLIALYRARRALTSTSASR